MTDTDGIEAGASQAFPAGDRRLAASDGRIALAITGGAALCLVAAGALMWWRHADAVFSSMVTAALAWCF